MFDFRKIDSCNMCGAGARHQKIIGRRLNTSQGWHPSKIAGLTVSVIKCCKCELIYSNPMPVPLGDEKLYDINPNEYWKESYFKITDDEIGNMQTIINEILPDKKGARLLDVGAGVGKQMKIFNTMGIECDGIEPSKSFYDFAISKMDIDPGRLQCCSVYDAIFPLNYFDFINCSAVLEHLTDPSEAIKKMMSWLKPNGVIFISVPYSNWLIGKVINWVYWLKGSAFVTNLCPMHPPYHLFEFGTKSFHLHAEANNYKIEKIHHVVCETFLFKMIDPFFKWVMKKTNTGMEINIWLKKV